MIAPVLPLILTWSAVPARDVTPALVRETELPRATLPPPDNPAPAVIVTEELARLALAMAVPFQVPDVIVPTVAISVPTNLEAAILPASIALVTLKAPMVVAKLPVPDPVTSPVKVIVWSPVLVPDKLAAERLLVTITFPVLLSPKVRVCLEVVAMVGVPYRVKLPDMVADPELVKEVTVVPAKTVVEALRVLKLALPEVLT